MKINGAIFDFDGTLVDSMGIWNNVGNEYLLNRNITPIDGLNDQLKTFSLVDSARYYQKIYKIKDSMSQIIKDITTLALPFYQSEIKLKSGVKDLLINFKNNGIKMYVIAGNEKNLVKSTLQRLEILDFFEGILTCNEVGTWKSQPHIYEKSIANLNTTKEDTIIFEDSLVAIESLYENGFLIAGVFDINDVEDQDKIKNLSNWYIKDDWSVVYD